MYYRLISYNHSKLLSNLVFDIYELSSKKKTNAYSTTPNGIIGISIKTSGQSFYKKDSSWEPISRCSIYGLINRPDNIKMEKNFREIAIGFKPFFFHHLSKFSMADMVNSPFIDAADIFDKYAVEELATSLQTASTDFEIINSIENFVAFHLSEKNYDSRALRAMDLIYNDNQYNVSEICKEVNLSSTGLRNLFKDKIGRSTKDVARIIRLNQTLKSHNPNQPTNLQDISFNNGYFDQAHFTRDFKSFLGLTPKEYFGNNSLTFDFYNFKRWSGNIFDKKETLK